MFIVISRLRQEENIGGGNDYVKINLGIFLMPISDESLGGSWPSD